MLLNQIIDCLNRHKNEDALSLLEHHSDPVKEGEPLLFLNIVALIRLNKVSEAVTHLKQAQKKYPDNKEFVYLLSELNNRPSLAKKTPPNSTVNLGSNYYSSVILTPGTFVNMAMSPENWQEILEFHSTIVSDDYTTYLDAYYREGVKRYGGNWYYMDITTVLYTASKLLQPKNYLEIGVRRGRSICSVVHGCKNVDIAAFDLWIKNYAGMENPGPEFVKQELQKHDYFGHIELINGDSHVTVPSYLQQHSDQRFDLITVDGDHSEQGAFSDLVTVIPKLAVGGMIVFDDIAHPSHPYLLNVWHQAVAQFPFLKSFEYTDAGYGVGFAIRMCE